MLYQRVKLKTIDLIKDMVEIECFNNTIKRINTQLKVVKSSSKILRNYLKNVA